MNSPIELRDTDTAQAFVLQSLWMQRTIAPNPNDAKRSLEWAMEIVSTGDPIPPLGLIADIGQLTFTEPEPDTDRVTLPNVSASLVRGYEDYVLGKFYADASFERGSDGLAKYSNPRDRSKGLAFLITQVMRRAEFRGVSLSPGVLRELAKKKPDELLAESWQSLNEQPLKLISDLYTELTLAIRQTGDLLGPEDVFELEHGTALAGFGQRVALRQLLRISGQQAAAFPSHPTHNKVRRLDVATNIRDEDTYPIGGFTSISNRGSIESLLQSQLSLMETDDDAQPDLFAIKFLRDELLYYSRDDNEFFRERRSFVVALSADLVQTRVKDAGMPCQRLVLTLAVLTAAIEKLIDWLSNDALVFNVLFVGPKNKPPLGNECELLEMIFREQIANGTVTVELASESDVLSRCEEYARNSLCHCVLVGAQDQKIETDSFLVTRLVTDAARPSLGIDNVDCQEADDDDDLQAWLSTGCELAELLL
jgi:hypothetical protein